MSAAVRGGVLALLMISVGPRAEARTVKIDIPPASCVQKKGDLVNYYTHVPPPDDFLYIEARATGFADMVCPVTIATDDAATLGWVDMSFEVRYEAQSQAAAGSDQFGCMMFWEFAGGTIGYVYPDFTGGQFTGGPIIGSGILKGIKASVQIPTKSSSEAPYQLSMHCYMTAKSRIHSIQITMTNPH